MRRIFHFITKPRFEDAIVDHEFKVPSLQSEGFIHCSLAEQVVRIANGILPGRDDMILLEIDDTKVIPEIVYENLEGGEQLFPHIYGPLNDDAIIAVHTFKWENGSYKFP